MSVHESRIAAALNGLRLNQTVFAVLACVSQTRLSQAFKGTKDFTGPEVQRLSKLIDALRQIAAEAAPVPVDFGNVAAVQNLLDHYENGVRWLAEPLADDGDVAVPVLEKQS